MKKYFEVKITKVANDESGNRRKVSETYLVDAVSFSEAEVSVYAKFEHEEISVKAIKESNILDVVKGGVDDDFYKCKVTFYDVDMDTNKEKKVTNYILVMAKDVIQATDRVNLHLSQMIVPYEVPLVSLTKIVDVIEYGY